VDPAARPCNVDLSTRYRHFGPVFSVDNCMEEASVFPGFKIEILGTPGSCRYKRSEGY
jgi:hypothetical protein